MVEPEGDSCLSAVKFLIHYSDVSQEKKANKETSVSNQGRINIFWLLFFSYVHKYL